MINPVNINPQAICFWPKIWINEPEICCAAPLAATNFPNIAPNTMIVTKDPKVSPSPFWMDFAKSGKGMPNKIPANKLISKKAINELTFKYVIRKTNKPMQAITINIVIGLEVCQRNQEYPKITIISDLIPKRQD